MGTVTTAAELFLRNADNDDVARPVRGPLVHLPRARDRVAPARRAVGRDPRPGPAAAHRRAARQHGGVPLLARRRRDQPLGDRRHQRDVPRRGARAADRPHRLPGPRHVRHVRRAPRRRAAPRSPATGCCARTTPTYATRARRRRRRPTSGNRPPTTTSTSSSSPRARPASRRPCAARRAGSRRTGMHVASIARARPRATSCTRRCRSSTPASLFTGLASALQARVPIGSRARFSASQHHARHPPHGRDDAHLHRQGPQLHPRRAAGARRRRHPARARDRQRGVGVRHPRVRGPLRLPGPRQLRLHRGDDHHPPRRDDAARLARPRRRHHRRCSTPTPARSARAAEFDARRPAAQRRRRGRRDRRTPRPATASRATTATRRRTRRRCRDGIYWSGDLAYRDADGWFYFAGRSNEWLRVDGENFAAGPVEAIVLRHPSVRSAAVYAVPDDPVGDRVMVAVEVDDVDAFDLDDVRRLPRRAARPRAEVGPELRAGRPPSCRSWRA